MTHRDTQLHRERQDPRPTHIFVVNKSLSGMGRSAYFHGDKMIFTCLHFGPSSLFSATSGRSPEPEEVGLPPSSVQRPLQSPGPRGGGGVQGTQPLSGKRETRASRSHSGPGPRAPASELHLPDSSEMPSSLLSPAPTWAHVFQEACLDYSHSMFAPPSPSSHRALLHWPSRLPRLKDHAH